MGNKLACMKTLKHKRANAAITAANNAVNMTPSISLLIKAFKTLVLLNDRPTS